MSRFCRRAARSRLLHAKGRSVLSGDRIFTGRNGWTVLMVPDGSRVVLTANSEFMVRSHDAKKRSGTFALITGMLRALITPSPKAPPDYSFNSLTAIAGVRGTDFTMLNRGQANVFFGNSGVVEVAGIQTATRNLTADTVVQTTRGKLPTQPVAITPNSPLADAQAMLSSLTDETPPAWEDAGKLPEIMARWNIGYSRFLADAGREEEALYALQLAQDLSDDADIQADCPAGTRRGIQPRSAGRRRRIEGICATAAARFLRRPARVGAVSVRHGAFAVKAKRCGSRTFATVPERLSARPLCKAREYAAAIPGSPFKLATTRSIWQASRHERRDAKKSRFRSLHATFHFCQSALPSRVAQHRRFGSSHQ
jgi:hypothetical protein